MQFDVIVGNPPYENPDGVKNKKIWLSFFEKSVSLLKEGGAMSYVTPTTHFWSLGRNWQTGECAEILLQKTNLTHVDFTVSKYFPKVGDYICAYTLLNEAPTGRVEVVEKDGTVVKKPHDDIFDTEEERQKAKFFRAMRRLRDIYGKYHIPHDTRDKSHYRDIPEGKYHDIALFDGSTLRLETVGSNHDPSDAVGALSQIHKAEIEKKHVTGLLYYNNEPKTLDEWLDLSETPLANLNEDELRPTKADLDSLMSEFRS